MAQEQHPTTPGIHAIAKKYLLRILDVCDREKISLTLVYPPDYADIQKARLNRDEIMNFYSGLAKERNVGLIRFDKDSHFSGTEYFRDVRHLNKKGAILLTELLIQSIYIP